MVVEAGPCARGLLQRLAASPEVARGSVSELPGHWDREEDMIGCQSHRAHIIKGN